MQSKHLKKSLKFLHELGTVGVMGAVLIMLVLAHAGAAAGTDAEHATIRALSRTVDRTVLLPSLLVLMTSGAFALAFHRPFHNADWAITKALMTPLVLEGTFMAVSAPAKAASKLTARLAEGDESVRARLGEVLSHEQWGLWLMFAVFTVNVVLSVWRPRMRRKHRPSAAASPRAEPTTTAAETREAA